MQICHAIIQNDDVELKRLLSLPAGS
jgi:hypothetical protein